LVGEERTELIVISESLPVQEDIKIRIGIVHMSIGCT